MSDANLFTPFIDPLAITIVVGGTLVATALRGPLTDSVAAFAALRRLAGTPFDPEEARARIVKAERISKGNLIAADAALLADRDVAAAVEAIGDGAGPDAVEALLVRRGVARRERHAIVQDYWAAAAEAAPAMGMVGTLLGLVRMFRAMSDPATIGSAMAVALLATLYGALLGNLVCAPIAARLRRQSRREELARRRLLAPLVALARRQSAAPSRRKESA
jgi:chemotaxis protein MotA